jgi:hypothetical protein
VIFLAPNSHSLIQHLDYRQMNQISKERVFAHLAGDAPPPSREDLMAAMNQINAQFGLGLAQSVAADRGLDDDGA